MQARMGELLWGEDGQTATEYMLIISVIVIALVSAAFLFYSPFKQGVSKLAADVQVILERGCLPGSTILRCGNRGG